MNNISIIGAGGHTRSSIKILQNYFHDSMFHIYDDSFVENRRENILGIELVGNIQQVDSHSKVFLSIGDNAKRELLFHKFNNQVIKDNLFHGTAIIENDVVLGESNQFFANSYINTLSIIGNNNIINTNALIEHETKIGNNNHISVGVKICGRVVIGNNCMIGAGVVIIDKISICNDVIIGAGAVVIQDILVSGTYVGNPARKVK